jgi:DNA-directed RNA polymerase specialized sigma subunit
MHKPRYNITKEYENLINEIRVEKGLTLEKLASLIGISPSHMWGISQGYHGPLHEQGGYLKKWVSRLENILGYGLSEIFPRDICSIEANNLTDEQIAIIAHGYGDQELTDVWELGVVAIVIQKYLSEREKIVIISRFFEGMTLEETGNIFGVSRDRARQIEAKALRLIRKFYHVIERRLEMES